MASNFFTRTRGLHPTPSACYPPPPPPPKKTVTGNWTVTPNPLTTLGRGQVDYIFNNDQRTTGEPIEIEWIDCYFTFDTSPIPQNNTPATRPIALAGAPGTYTGKAKVTWLDGTIRTFPYIYTINP